MNMVTNSFQNIRRSRGITIHQVADLAGIEPREEFLFEIGARIEQEQAENIVSAFNMLSGEHYKLTDFREPIAEQLTTPIATISIPIISDRRITRQTHSGSKRYSHE
jgi:hypothetical protein